MTIVDDDKDPPGAHARRAAIKAAQRAFDIAFANLDEEERRFDDLKRSS